MSERRHYPIGRNSHPWPMSKTPEARGLEVQGNRIAETALHYCLCRNKARREGNEELAEEFDVQASAAMGDSDRLFEQWRKAAGCTP
jgi:hypothetical protein